MNHLIKQSTVEQLRRAQDRSDLAKILGLPHNFLTYVLFHLGEPKYETRTIPKKGGGSRELLIPHKKLKFIQKKLSNLLYDYIGNLENSNKKKPIFKQAHGYVKNKSIHSNAWLHKNKKYILNFDIENFFGSINFGRVRGFFIENINFKLNEDVATAIAQICCHENTLPQGSPCSPVVSNLIGHYLDGQLVSLSRKYKCLYTRYVDDITMSTNKDILPSSLTKLNIESNKYVIGNEIKSVVEKCGFVINDSKTRLSFCDSRQTVTGLVVSREKINTRKEYYKYARAMTNSLITTGNFVFPTVIKPIDIPDIVNANTIKLREEKENEDLSKKILRLEGILKHIYFSRNYKHRQFIPKKINIESSAEKKISKGNKLIEIDIKNARNENNKSRINPNSDYHRWASEQKILWKFLIFKNFISLDKPLLICEGSTDIIYLKYAIKYYCKKYPEKYKILGEYDEDKFKFNIQFYRYYSIENQKKLMNSNRIIGLTGGLSSMRNFIILYLDFLELYGKNIPRFPVILITDNDDTKNASRNNIDEAGNTFKDTSSYSVFEKCKDRSFKKSNYDSKRKKYYYVKNNLYLVRLPQDYRNRKIKEIEDLLPKKIRDIPYKRKIYDAGKRTPQYKLFLVNYVIKNHSTINFSAFKNILDKCIKVNSNYIGRSNPNLK